MQHFSSHCLLKSKHTSRHWKRFNLLWKFSRNFLRGLRNSDLFTTFLKFRRSSTGKNLPPTFEFSNQFCQIKRWYTFILDDLRECIGEYAEILPQMLSVLKGSYDQFMEMPAVVYMRIIYQKVQMKVFKSFSFFLIRAKNVYKFSVGLHLGGLGDGTKAARIYDPP
jgi:hypothetical protein